ncbi:MAG: hypothetical protein LBI10_03785 [Deltaproteobacteria bacterium]|jgi:hypothetical protein|nr:hypothetical protein [Deltaproteobacteria bacterium]
MNTPPIDLTLKQLSADDQLDFDGLILAALKVLPELAQSSGLAPHVREIKSLPGIHDYHRPYDRLEALKATRCLRRLVERGTKVGEVASDFLAKAETLLKAKIASIQQKYDRLAALTLDQDERSTLPQVIDEKIFYESFHLLFIKLTGQFPLAKFDQPPPQLKKLKNRDLEQEIQDLQSESESYNVLTATLSGKFHSFLSGGAKNSLENISGKPKRLFELEREIDKSLQKIDREIVKTKAQIDRELYYMSPDDLMISDVVEALVDKKVQLEDYLNDIKNLLKIEIDLDQGKLAAFIQTLEKNMTEFLEDINARFSDLVYGFTFDLSAFLALAKLENRFFGEELDSRPDANLDFDLVDAVKSLAALKGLTIQGPLRELASQCFEKGESLLAAETKEAIARHESARGYLDTSYGSNWRDKLVEFGLIRAFYETISFALERMRDLDEDSFDSVPEDYEYEVDDIVEILDQLRDGRDHAEHFADYMSREYIFKLTRKIEDDLTVAEEDYDPETKKRRWRIMASKIKLFLDQILFDRECSENQLEYELARFSPWFVNSIELVGALKDKIYGLADLHAGLLNSLAEQGIDLASLPDEDLKNSFQTQHEKKQREKKLAKKIKKVLKKR